MIVAVEVVEVAIEIKSWRRLFRGLILEIGPGVEAGYINNFAAGISEVAGILRADSKGTRCGRCNATNRGERYKYDSESDVHPV